KADSTLDARRSTLDARHRSLSPQPLLAFATGCLLPYALTCLILWRAGVFRQFVFWTISYASKYAAANAMANRSDLLRTAWDAAAGPNVVFWILPWIGAVLMWWEERLRERSAGGMERWSDGK